MLGALVRNPAESISYRLGSTAGICIEHKEMHERRLLLFNHWFRYGAHATSLVCHPSDQEELIGKIVHHDTNDIAEAVLELGVTFHQSKLHKLLRGL